MQSTGILSQDSPISQNLPTGTPRIRLEGKKTTENVSPGKEEVKMYNREREPGVR